MQRQSDRRRFLQASAAMGIGSWIGADAAAQDRSPGDQTAAGPRGASGQGGEKTSGWKVYIMTDMEGVAGVLDFESWCEPVSRYYEMGKEFLTLEVNAAIEGFSRGGATEFLVADGHGAGAINPKLLDPRAQLARHWPPHAYPVCLEKGMHFAAWIGQHAMSRTEHAHIAHTGSFGVFESTVNGVPVGEFAEVALCASQLGVRTIFGAGDLAFTKEAQALVPGVETVAVKRGTMPGRGDECDAAAYSKRNLAAIHYQPRRARQMILAGAERAIRRAVADKGFGIIPLKPPFEKVTILRARSGQAKQIGRSSHPSDVIAMMNAPMKYEPLKK